MIRINLLAADRADQEEEGGARPVGPGLGAGLPVPGPVRGRRARRCARWATCGSRRQLSELDSEIAAAQQRQRELQAIKKQVDDLEAEAGHASSARST